MVRILVWFVPYKDRKAVYTTNAIEPVNAAYIPHDPENHQSAYMPLPAVISE
jgi:hypothetical protein